jgi:phosphatidate cytidylyltransferase
MTKKPSSTVIRLASAFVALVVLFGLYYFFQSNGLIAIVLGCALKAQMEYTELTIERPQQISFSRALLVAGCFILTLSALLSPKALGLPVGFVLVSFFSYFLIHYRNSESLTQIRDLIGISALGLLYVGVLPAFIIALFKQPSGDVWLFTLLGIVFIGDSAAYFIGKAFGKTKMLPSISPNKTWAGSFGGLLGSMLASVIAKHLFFADFPLLPLIVLALVTGAAAQVGDFFESLLKRVANKKDSGTLMPGHGGILDRIDGVLFAAPFIYFAALYFPTFFGT